ncbi:O-antigen ligase family protein [Methylophaga thiooxydans]|uniref:O-antigen ligase family protein n=1 Tax=Methylophaga thiooxydans TaxID=392484 RepID=UPI001375DA6B|nr:O-antigen ligase family protein [Methylophaga thiooxydans]
MAEVMLVILFLLAPLYYHPNLGGEGLRIPNNITVWLIAIIFITFSINKVIKAEFFQLPRYFGYLTAFPILVILSGFLAGVEQPLNWLFRVLFILGGFAFLFSLFQHKLKAGRWDRLLLIIALSGFIHAGIGLLQIWLKLDMPFLLPKSPQGIPSGLFQQINNQASYLATCIILSFYLASRPLVFKRRFNVQALLLVTVLVSSIVVGLSGSRTGWLALAIALPVILLARREQLWSNKSLSVVLLAALVSGFVFGTMNNGGKTIDKTVAIQSGYSGSARLGIYTISLDLLAQKPWFGHGVGSFPRQFQYARPDFYIEYPEGKLPKQMINHPHNELLQWMVEGGVSALLGIVISVTALAFALYKVGPARGFSYLALLIPISLHTQLELPFYMSALHWLVFMLLVAQIFQATLKQRQNLMTPYAKKLASISIVLTSLLVATSLLHTIRANWDFVFFYDGDQSGVPLSIATQNPYLSSEAKWISMGALLNFSIKNGIDENVVFFTEWGEQTLLVRPDVDLYMKLISAYDFLGNKNAFCTKLMQALKLYPDNKQLTELKHVCNN